MDDKISILGYYKYMSTRDNIARKYYQCGKTDYGSPLKLFNTNYRTLFGVRGSSYTGIANGFLALEKDEGKDRADFVKSGNTLQEKNKQHTVRMRNSWLYQERNGVFTKTKRGIVFGKMLEENMLTANEKKLLCFMLILPGYFYDTPNYLCRRTEKLFSYCIDAGYSEDEILKLQVDFLVKGIRNGWDKKQLMQLDYFYIANFIIPYSTDINFLQQFRKANEVEKQSLKDYVSKTNEFHILGKKYESGGNFTTNTLLETTWLMHLCKTIKKAEIESFEKYTHLLISTFNVFYPVSEQNIQAFIALYHSVFEVIYRDVFDIKENALPVKTKRTLTKKEVEEIGIIDPTDNEGQEQLKEVSETLKKFARQESDYHCIMEIQERCRYFTSKETSHNYVEVHHFIPRAVANRFDNSIEVLSNYVPLCPHCHRKIHLATDREREYMINYIYSQRKSALEEKGIIVQDVEDIYKFYGITD